MIIDAGRFIYFNKIPYMRKQIFLNLLGVRTKSYIGQVMGRIHDYFFKNSLSLKWEYNCFYKKEFISFQEFLEKKHNLFKIEANKLSYKNALYSEKLEAEHYKAAGLLQYYDADNVIRDTIFNILGISELQESRMDNFDED